MEDGKLCLLFAYLFIDFIGEKEERSTPVTLLSLPLGGGDASS